MTTQPTNTALPQPRAMVAAFPKPGRRIARAYRELEIAMYGTDNEKKALGPFSLLRRPWEPASLTEPADRSELWRWLDEVVLWVNHEYVWDTDAMIPACWPRHPHLVHEIAVIADLRYRSGHALTSDPLEEWHRYALPAFVERMRARTKTHCEDKEHQPWPSHGRYTRQASEEACTDRRRAFTADTETLGPEPPTTPPSEPARAFRVILGDDARPALVDGDTGEVLE